MDPGFLLLLLSLSAGTSGAGSPTSSLPGFCFSLALIQFSVVAYLKYSGIQTHLGSHSLKREQEIRTSSLYKKDHQRCLISKYVSACLGSGI